jgi:hypothetical protein
VSSKASRALEYSSQPGENVLDLCGGSGSTLIVAEQTRRQSFLMELDPLYCDVIVQRYEQFTGQKADRVRPGRSAEKTYHGTGAEGIWAMAEQPRTIGQQLTA